MKFDAIVVYCVESERGEIVARYLNRTEAHAFASQQQRLRGPCPIYRLHVVAREFVPKAERPAIPATSF